MKRTGYNLYTLPLETKKIQAAGNAWWMCDAVIVILVILLSTLDAVTLYTVFDTVLTEAQSICVIVTAGCAVSLNFIPLVTSRLIHDYRYCMNGVRLWMIIGMAFIFLLLFAATFYLRWSTRQLAFAGLGESMVETTGQTVGFEDINANTEEAVSITLLLGVMPLITSAINLALGFLNDDPLRRKISALRIHIASMKQGLAIMDAAEKELDQDWLHILCNDDEKRYNSAVEAVFQGGQLISTKARLLLAEKLRTPEAITQLTEPEVEEGI